MSKSVARRISIQLTDEQMKNLWIANVFNRGEDIDPADDYHWFSMAIGFFLALTDSDVERSQMLTLELVKGDYI
jgi:hypothetical protein